MTIPHLDDEDDDGRAADDPSPDHAREAVTGRGRHAADEVADDVAYGDVGRSEGLAGNPAEPPD
jgi:hypothetical protein